MSDDEASPTSPTGPTDSPVPGKSEPGSPKPKAGSSNLLMEGWLKKEGGTVKNWKKRWFTLDEDSATISYFKKKEDSKPIKSFVIEDQLAQRTKERNKEYCFKIVTAARVLYMCAENDDEVEQWLKAFTKCSCTVVKEQAVKRPNKGKMKSMFKSESRIQQMDVGKWSPDDVVAWAKRLVLDADPETKERYAEAFRINQIDGKQLLEELDDKMMRDELDIDNYGHRKMILAGIEMLRKARVFDPSANVLFEKIRRKSDYFGTNQHEWVFLANSLAKSQSLKDYYLTLDQEQLDKIMEKLPQEAEEDKGFDLVEGANNDAFNSLEALEKIQGGNSSRKPKIRVKLVITEISSSTGSRTLRSLLSPLMYSIPQLRREFGIFHSALIIGPWYLEWTNSSLCVPRRIGSSMAILSADIGNVTTCDDVNMVIDKLAEVITDWNVNFEYENVNLKGEPFKGNCQDFLDAVLEKLGIKLNFDGTPLGEYLLEMKKKGTCDVSFKPNEKFREKFSIAETKIEFNNHFELDEFVSKIVEISGMARFEFPAEWMLLKSFDRAFWLRHIRNPNDNRFKPLGTYDEETGRCETCNCPFDDPRNTGTFMQ